MINKLLLIISLISVISCKKDEDYLVYDNQPRIERKDETIQVRNLLRNAKIDILWVVDNSGSMSTIQSNIVRNANLFMQNFIQNNFMQWKMGVVSTDKLDEPYLGFLNVFDNSSVDQVRVFSDAIGRLGTDGDASEYVFYNVMRMLIDPMYTSFFRADAHLAVIMVTDEEEQSEDRFGSNYSALSTINSIRSFKNAESIIRFYGAFNFGDLASCSNYVKYKNSPFEEIINETSGIHMSACTADFGKNLAAIGKDIISLADTPSILLKERPKLETLEVYYNDILIPGGKEGVGYWYYTKYTNTVNFYNLDFIPDLNDADIRVKYDIDDGLDRSEEE